MANILEISTLNEAQELVDEERLPIDNEDGRLVDGLMEAGSRSSSLVWEKSLPSVASTIREDVDEGGDSSPPRAEEVITSKVSK